MKKYGAPLAVAFLVLLADQVLKVWVKTNMYIGENIYLFGQKWAVIHFTENEGMAFGLELGGDYGKLMLTVFRMIAVSGIAYYLYYLIKHNSAKGLIISIALIMAGALGNIIDSAIYGLIFSESTGWNSDTPYQIATAFSGNGYGTLLHGKVVDMLHFPIIEGHLPEWIPFKGGDYFKFFSPVFNIADAAISIGVFMIIIFNKRYFPEPEPQQSKEDVESAPENQELEQTDVDGSISAPEGDDNIDPERPAPAT